MNFTTNARIWPTALALFVGAALAGAASASAQAVGSRLEASEPGFPTGEQALLGKFAGLAIQPVAATERSAVSGPAALLHGGPLALREVRETGDSQPVCGEMALLHRHSPSGRSP